MIQKMSSVFHQRYLMPMMINDMNMKNFYFILTLLVLQIEGYAVKIALDEAGMIDNKREMLYTKDLQPYESHLFLKTIRKR